MHLCEGLQNKEIAEAVAFTEATVKMHVNQSATKLGARNRTQAVLAAQRERYSTRDATGAVRSRPMRTRDGPATASAACAYRARIRALMVIRVSQA